VAVTQAAYAQEPPPAQPAGGDASTSDIDRARALAKQAKRALEKAQGYSEALDDATRAEALYHAPIHLAIIGEALIGMGRLAEAMTTLERLVSEPLPPNASDAFRTAQEEGQRRLKALSARVPSLLLIVKGPPPTAVTLTVDNKPFELRGGTATRLDAGVHKVHAVASGYQTFDRTVTLPARGGVVMVEAPMEVSWAPAAGIEKPGPPPASPPSRAPWIAAFSVGAAGFIAGGISGGIFVSRVEALKARCPANHCAATDRSDAQSITTLGNVSTAALVVGGVGAVAGGIVILTQRFGRSAPRKTAEPSALSSSAKAFALGLTPGGVSVKGWF
jgi:hypothetical protein